MRIAVIVLMFSCLCGCVFKSSEQRVLSPCGISRDPCNRLVVTLPLSYERSIVRVWLNGVEQQISHYQEGFMIHFSSNLPACRKIEIAHSLCHVEYVVVVDGERVHGSCSYVEQDSLLYLNIIARNNALESTVDIKSAFIH